LIAQIAATTSIRADTEGMARHRAWPGFRYSHLFSPSHKARAAYQAS
jgi:hypothetical protein